eukprot:279450_1
MKRNIHALKDVAVSAVPLKRKRLNTTKKRTFRTRVIGAMDIRSSLTDYCIEIKEDNLYLQYWPNFYSTKESKEILQELEKSVEYNNDEDSSVIVFGKKHKIARKQQAFGDKGTSYKFSGNDVLAKHWNKLPLIHSIKKKIETHLCKVVHKNENKNKNKNNKEETKQDNIGNEFNFCLVNRYNNGNDKIGFHKDDEKDLINNSSIADVSFGAMRDIIFKHQDIVRNKNNNNMDFDQVKSVKIALKNGSLIVMRYPTNSYWYHSIPKRATVKNVRVSLTFRNMIPRKK